MGETREERLARIDRSMPDRGWWYIQAEDVAWLIAEVERQHRQLVVARHMLKLSGYARSVIDSNLNDAEYAARIVDGSA